MLKDFLFAIQEDLINYEIDRVLLKASIIIVTYNSDHELLFRNLKSLKEQTYKNFEILVIDNSDKGDLKSIISKYSLRYIKLKKNYGLSLARNVGINLAKGNILIFLDDDAIPARDFVEEHLKAHNKYDIIGLRGKAIPRSRSIFNYFAVHYDLGDKVIPWFIDLEGNSSFKKEVLLKVGGFNPNLSRAGGHEGTELSYRILNIYKDKHKLIYYPHAIIYHDYSTNLIQYLKKQLRHSQHADFIKNNFPDIFQFVEEYKIPFYRFPNDVSFTIKIRLKLISQLASSLIRMRRGWLNAISS
ncbi:MAG: hypothetical protein DRG40_00240 [Deltaproteobacteria bacterium]|nr:MAG: hypothetical protein DRG40_00240 [Deltaproteobacteria bacterium]